MMRRGLGWFFVGLAAALVALWVGSPRHWSAVRVNDQTRAALARQDAVAAKRWFPLFVARQADRPTELLAVGPLVANLGDADLLRRYAGLVEEAVSTDNAAAAALLWRAQASAMEGDTPAAKRQYEEIRERFWDHHQALEAETELRKLGGRGPAEAIHAAAAAGDWPRVLELAGDIVEKPWFPEDRDLAASHVLEALLVLGRDDRAAARLAAWAVPERGLNLPAIVLPGRLASYPSAGRVLKTAAAKLAADNPWRTVLTTVAAALGKAWPELADSVGRVNAATALVVVDFAAQQGADAQVGERLMRALLAREDLQVEQRLRALVSAARFRLAHEDRSGALEAVAQGRALKPDDPVTGELETLAVEAGDKPPADKLAAYDRIIERWASHAGIVLGALGEAQQLLVEAGRRDEACELGRRHRGKLPDPAQQRAAVQVCPLD